MCQCVSGAAGYHSHLSIAWIFLGDFFVTKPLSVKEKQQRKRVRNRNRNAAKSPGVPYAQRFYSERKPHGMLATARVIDNKRQKSTVYLLDETSAAGLALDLNHLEEFKATMKSAVTMRAVITNMLAIESAEDLDQLTKACDRNRELLYTLEVGPFKPTSHSSKVRDEKDAIAQEDATTSEDPEAALWG